MSSQTLRYFAFMIEKIKEFLKSSQQIKNQSTPKLINAEPVQSDR